MTDELQARRHPVSVQFERILAGIDAARLRSDPTHRRRRLGQQPGDDSCAASSASYQT